MEEFKKKQLLIIKNGGRISDDLEAESFWIGDKEYSAMDFRKKIFSVYMDAIKNKKEFQQLLSYRKQKCNIVLAGDTAFTSDINDLSRPFMSEGMLFQLLSSSF